MNTWTVASISMVITMLACNADRKMAVTYDLEKMWKVAFVVEFYGTVP
jgi:ribosomal silencing factor RsfS